MAGQSTYEVNSKFAGIERGTLYGPDGKEYGVISFTAGGGPSYVPFDVGYKDTLSFSPGKGPMDLSGFGFYAEIGGPRIAGTTYNFNGEPVATYQGFRTNGHAELGISYSLVWGIDTTPTFAVGTISSARVPGIIGGIKATDTLNALDAIAESRAWQTVECFPANTEILMFDGGSKPIQDIRIGDVVLAYDSNVAQGKGGLHPKKAAVGADHMMIHVTTGQALKGTDRLLRAAGMRMVGGSYVG